MPGTVRRYATSGDLGDRLAEGDDLVECSMTRRLPQPGPPGPEPPQDRHAGRDTRDRPARSNEIGGAGRLDRVGPCSQGAQVEEHEFAAEGLRDEPVARDLVDRPGEERSEDLREREEGQESRHRPPRYPPI
jgi:hypothetical protein